MKSRILRALVLSLLALCVIPARAQEGMELPLSSRYQEIGKLTPTAAQYTFKFSEVSALQTVIQFMSTVPDLRWKLTTSDNQSIDTGSIGAAGGAVMVLDGRNPETENGPMGIQAGNGLYSTVIAIPGAKVKSLTVYANASQIRREAPVFFSVEFINGTFALGLMPNDGDVGLSQPIAITAAAFYKSDPIRNALIEAVLISPTGCATKVECRDDGRAPDQRAGDGLFTANFLPDESGSWEVGVMGKLESQGYTVLRSNSGNFDVTDCNLRFVRTAPVTAQCVYSPQTGYLSDVVAHAVVTVSDEGDYNFTATARVGASTQTVEWTTGLHLMPGMQSVDISVPAGALRQSGTEGVIQITEIAAYCTFPYAVRSDRWALQNVTACSLSILDFPGADVEMLEPCTSELEDTDGDTLADFLILNVPLAVRHGGWFRYNAALCDSCGRVIDEITGYVSLVRSARVILPLAFDGRKIGRNGVDGPYHLCRFVLWRTDGTGVFMGWSNGCETDPYTVDQFEDWVRCPDRNNNGKCDACEIHEGGQGIDRNGDGIPDDSPHQEPCVRIADIVGPGGAPAAPNGCVDEYDLAAFLDAYYRGAPLADVSGPDGVPDGVVDQYDWDAFMQAFYQCEKNCDPINPGK